MEPITLDGHGSSSDRMFLYAQQRFLRRYKPLFTTRWNGSSWGTAEKTWRAAQSYFSALQIPGVTKNMQRLSERFDIPEDRFNQFIRESPWEHDAVQWELNADLPPEFRSDAGILLVDGMPILKDGKASVGVARQWAGNVGKVANSQHAVDLTLTIPDEQRSENQVTWPLGMELYVPEAWLTAPEYESRRRDVRLPEDLPFRTKPDIALDLIERAREAGVPHACIGADSEYGDSREFRSQLQAWGEPYLLEVTPSELRVIPEETPIEYPEEYDGPGRQPTVPRYPKAVSATSPAELANDRDEDDWTEITWTEGVDGPRSGTFFRTRTRTVTNTQRRAVTDEEAWLLVGKVGDRLKAWLCWGLGEWSLDDLVLYANQRWTIEHFHREAKQFLGINEFEGRTWDGWHHHVTMVLLAHTFLARERVLREDSEAETLKPLSKLAYEVARETCTQELMEEMGFERDIAEEAASRQMRVLFGKP